MNMKQRDLKPCSACGKGVMNAGIPIFYRFKMDTMGVDADAVRQVHGLEEVMLGNVAIAQALGPDPDIVKEIDSKEIILCHSCMMSCNAGSFIGG